jgi:RimJ/RimL family protein N-acetyltransferase
VIRPLLPLDAALYRDIRLEGLRLHPEAFGASYDDEVQLTEAEFAARIPAAPPDAIFGAFIADALVGVVGFHARFASKQTHRADVWGMFVRSSARGQGVAAGLIARVVQHARSIPGLERVHLTVEQNGQVARRLYEAAGFRAYGVEPKSLKVAPGIYYDAELRVLDL